MLQHYLHSGSSYVDADIAVTEFCQKFPHRVERMMEAQRQRGGPYNTRDSGRPPTLDEFFEELDKEAKEDVQPTCRHQ